MRGCAFHSADYLLLDFTYFFLWVKLSILLLGADEMQVCPALYNKKCISGRFIKEVHPLDAATFPESVSLKYVTRRISNCGS